MITHIKIFGERNSGTRFLHELLNKNILGSKIYQSNYNDSSGWKHGFPNLKRFSNLENTLFIFIIRDLESWIVSMYNNPYHYKRPKTMQEFIHGKLQVRDKRPDHDVYKYARERQNIINLRYDKIRQYVKFYEAVPNAIFINLSDLQANNAKFLQHLRDTYKIKIRDTINSVEHHTKNNQITATNRIYAQSVPAIPNRDNIIEQFVKNLKDNYLFKSKVQ